MCEVERAPSLPVQATGAGTLPSEPVHAHRYDAPRQAALVRNGAVGAARAWSMAGAVVACALLACAPLATQAQPVRGVPGYAPLNPVIAGRSSLATYPFRAPLPDWTFTLAIDYGSATELDRMAGASYVLDAELARAELSITRALDARHFVLLQGSALHAGAGFADAFFDSFHRLIRYEQWSRANRPRNEFAYDIALPGGETIEREPVRAALGDVLFGFGRRHSRSLQSLATLSLPTSTAPRGYRRGVPSVGVSNSAHWEPHDRLALEAALGGGYSPRSGELSTRQRTVFAAASSGVRLRVWRDHALYGAAFYHSPVYRDTALPELENGQLTIDFGLIVAGGEREWRIGLVEDTRATDAGIDLVLRLSAAW